jgi:hypothetical protein
MSTYYIEEDVSSLSDKIYNGLLTEVLEKGKNIKIKKKY